jgi:hypothetical protein
VTGSPTDGPPGDAGDLEGSGAHPPEPSPPPPYPASPLGEEASLAVETDEQHDRSVGWLADYVYGTISTLVALAGLTFETNPGALTTAGVVVVGAVAIWLAHGLSRLVILRTWQNLELHPSDVSRVLQGSWTIVVAAVPGALIFVLAALHVWSVRTAFTVAEAVGVLALAVVGSGTVGGQGRPLGRRLVYIGGLVMVGVLIVLLELLVHLTPHGRAGR